MFCILDPETVKVKTTHHVQFNDHVFPNKNQENLNQNTESFVISGSLDIPSNTQINSNCSEIPKTQYNVELSPNGENDNNQNVTTDTLWQYKGYSWMTEPVDDSKEIMSNLDPASILTNSCQTKKLANFVEAIVLDPKSFSQAIHHPDSKQWLAAIENELSNMKTHQVWSSHEQDESINPLTTTWVFKKKTDANGNLTKYKARLCVRGFNQQEGIDYNDVFSPTGRLASLRLLLTLAHQHGFQVDRMDVRCAFLDGIRNKLLYIFRPDGYNKGSKILKLNKSLYGLKQSPRCWHKALNDALLQMGLVPTKTDPCLYYLSDHNKPMWLFAHIDDLIFKGISMIQDKLIQQILSEFNLENARPLTSPLPSNINDLKSPDLEPCQNPPFHYRRAIRLLQYLVQGTRPDLAFSTSFMSQFLESPSKIHFKAVEHILKYLLGTKGLTLQLGGNNLQHDLNTIIGISDADWGGSKECRSFSGSLIYYQGAIGWRSHKQKVVALSSAEAEYNALTECSQDLLWLKQLIHKISTIKCSGTLFSDNQSAIAIASNQIYHHGTRHINFRLHFIRDLIEKSKIRLQYLPTTYMVADSLTKNFPIKKVKNHLKTMFGNEATIPRYGDVLGKDPSGTMQQLP
ncbi:hypothetical protein O181_000846 [Austropuccinia psidii MF-1]|uniref:Reverse transcriptase Ty1/copia-type domain-containing protein n=1 Tax=Austropuccinia psidii MF-1 TaxID=1389203 RepID=A0A9Q3B993_9BASI|nr:hypothetical protein [Austropuccinia psidii MF-1]